MLNSGAISWASRKIKVLSLSSFKSKWYSASICRCKVVVMSRLLEEIGREQAQPTTIFKDNAVCIYTAMHNNKPLGENERVFYDKHCLSRPRCLAKVHCSQERYMDLL